MVVFVFMVVVVVVAALVGLVEVARVVPGPLEPGCTARGCVVVVRTEVSRAAAGRVVVVRAETRLSDFFFRSVVFVIVVVVLGGPFFGAAISNLRLP